MNVRVAIFAFVLALASCTSPPPISKNPLGNVLGANDTITQGIANAQYNFNQAMSLDILPATDPAPDCLNSVAALLGIGTTASPSFTPKITDLISAGSVGYIYIQQLKMATGSTLQVSPQCEQLIGQIVIDAQRAGLKGATGLFGGVGLGVIPPVIP